MRTQDILLQSKSAYNQWCEQWREHCKRHSKFEMKPLNDFANKGIGRAVLCVANGFSLEENIEAIKKYQTNVDIMACDKTFGHLVSNGITPTYLLVADANVNYTKYLEPYLDKTSETILLMNVCGNPEWTEKAKWKDIRFFANKDILKSEEEFCKISGCKNVIPAATNVSNAMVVMLTQSDNNGRRNFFGYDKILLIGFDYSWRHGKGYYAFDKNADNKAHYMCHNYITVQSGEFAYTSGNLAFSASWISEYIKTFRLPVVNCSKATIMSNVAFGDIEKQMQYKFQPEDSSIITKALAELSKLIKQKEVLEKQIESIAEAHWLSHIKTS